LRRRVPRLGATRDHGLRRGRPLLVRGSPAGSAQIKKGVPCGHEGAGARRNADPSHALIMLTAYAPASWRSVTAAWRCGSSVSSSSPLSSRRARTKVARWIASTVHTARPWATSHAIRSEEHTSELQSPCNLVCRLLLEKKKKTNQ